MVDKIYLSVFITFLLLSAGLGAASAAADRSYTIPFINMDLYPQEDGTLHVKETLHYSFEGTYNGIYRDIPIGANQHIQNIKVSSDGAYSHFEEINNGNNKRIKVYLYSDPQMTTPITDRDVDVVIEYDFVHVIKFYNDIAELHYKLIGEWWEVDIGQINAYIHLKSNDGVKYWLNPPYYNGNSSWQGNTLYVSSENVPRGHFYEIRMVMPKDQFQANPTGGAIINQNGLAEIEKVQSDYQNLLNFKTFFYQVLTVIMLLICLIPIVIYLIYGREPKIDYRAEYERDIPTDDLPAIVNAICGSSKVGEPNKDGFKATIMDLIDRKYILFSAKKSNKEDYSLKGEHKLFFKINHKMRTSKLKKFEKEIIKFLRCYERKGKISLDEISEGITHHKRAQSFAETYYNWKDIIREDFVTDDELKKMFNKRGDTYLKMYAVATMILAVFVFLCTVVDHLPAARWPLISSLILGIVAILSFFLPQRIAGQWTTYGEEYDAKWQNFERYIQDFSLIKEYPPESVVIWNKYLVYATALGVAKAVLKVMEKSLPKDQIESSEIYRFHYYGGYYMLSNAIGVGIDTTSTGNGYSGGFGGGGGVGGVGGGSGGGGGGAF